MSDIINESEEKAAFAALLLKTPGEPFKAALALFPDNTNRALWVANHWVNDSEVIAIKEKIVAEAGEGAFLPNKSELARDIWSRMQGVKLDNGHTIPTTADDYAKLAKLYAEVRGFIEKPNAGPNINVIVPKAIEVPTHGTDEEWEQAAQTQQRELLDVSRSRH